jgi:uncharacterized damage-inducible protein DinB
MTDRMESLEGNLLVLRQAVDVLGRLDDAGYSGWSATPGGSPIGAHFRHIFDHYRAFLAGLASGEIDYDARERQVPLERDRRLAIATALGFMTDLGRIPGDFADRPLRVTVRSVAGQDGSPDWSQTTVKRELQFLVSHSVHHYALIKEVLRQSGFDAGEEFGVAPSTIAALRHGAAACVR